MRETRAVFHKVGSIGQKTRDLKRATRTRGTRVSEHLDATMAPIRRRGLVAFAARMICAAGLGEQPIDDFVDSESLIAEQAIGCFDRRSQEARTQYFHFPRRGVSAAHQVERIFNLGNLPKQS
jgi:hypothetical protein